MSGPIEPGGPTQVPYAARVSDLPAVPGRGEGERIRMRDLPAAEQLRRKVEDAVLYVARRHGRLLTADAVCKRFLWPAERAAEVAVALNDPVTVANLKAEGVVPPEVASWDDMVAGRVAPSKAQMDVLEEVLGQLDPSDDRALGPILAEKGLDLKQWHGWLADPVFGAYVRDRTAQVLGNAAGQADIALMRRASAGDVQALKLLYQLQGKLGRDSMIDVNAVLAQVVTIIQDEIDDRDTIVRIAQRLQALSDQVSRRQLPAGAPIIPGEVATG